MILEADREPGVPAVVEEIVPARPQRPADDHYDTPPEATRALLSVERFAGSIWECCAGAGEMAAPLREAGYQVAATTVGERHWPRDRPKFRVEGGVDFLRATRLRAPNIVTNPPFKKNLPEQILRQAIELDPVKIALLLNVKFLAGIKRKDSLFGRYPPIRVWVFSDRITMYPHGWTGDRNSTTETMAWLIWEAPFVRPGRPFSGGWLNSQEFRLVPNDELKS